MIFNRKELARKALTLALQTRIRAKRPLWDSVCVFDLARELDVEVRFLDTPSMEGLYCKEPGPVILLPSERPASRQHYSCAHELGHHFAGHGTRVDELIEGKTERYHVNDDPDEFFVECFAGFLLMPKVAVERAIACRGWTPATLQTEQAYVVAGQLGVGYTTLLKHMRWSLGILPAANAERLLQSQPKQIRRELFGEEIKGNLFVVDHHWIGRPIDIHVGDSVAVPHDVIVEGANLRRVRETDTSLILEGIRPGVGRLSLQSVGWASFIRVSRAAYVGLAEYRHTEDPDDA